MMLIFPLQFYIWYMIFNNNCVCFKLNSYSTLFIGANSFKALLGLGNIWL